MHVLVCSLTFTAVQYGLVSAAELGRLEAFIRRAKKLGYCAESTASIKELIHTADKSLFERIRNSDSHLLRPLLPH